MSVRTKAVLCRGITLAICLASSGAWACSAGIARGQATVYGQLDTAPGQLPQEVELNTGDLLSVLAPRGARMLTVDANGKEATTVIPLEAARYQALSTQGRGTVPMEVRADAYPKSLAWQHFGAAEPGLAYLKLSAGKERGLVRVRVMERPAIQRGTDLVWSDARQQETIYLSQFDTLTLELPGEPGNGWQVSARSGKAVLQSVSQTPSEANAPPAQVRLRVAVVPGAPEDELIVRRTDGGTYRFVVRPQAVPAC